MATLVIRGSLTGSSYVIELKKNPDDLWGTGVGHTAESIPATLKIEGKTGACRAYADLFIREYPNEVHP